MFCARLQGAYIIQWHFRIGTIRDQHACTLIEYNFAGFRQSSRLIPYTDWVHNAHSVPFEQSVSGIRRTWTLQAEFPAKLFNTKKYMYHEFTIEDHGKCTISSA